ncbi:hypothetical protein HELRODRAFT_170113 [Helobdella robusta]|uniref:Uncharacterized protein n=1 Tax=Helobdella robusta TaxID=6412 RepID=T1F2N2_HELRO|nr:hypothetical protein HELRODRAFT_170113 [Helobdella robusta]ESO07567.1 hypothetical protein HELRODRAFT_170113 [Helobdella robusta]
MCSRNIFYFIFNKYLIVACENFQILKKYSDEELGNSCYIKTLTLLFDGTKHSTLVYYLYSSSQQHQQLQQRRHNYQHQHINQQPFHFPSYGTFQPHENLKPHFDHHHLLRKLNHGLSKNNEDFDVQHFISDQTHSYNNFNNNHHNNNNNNNNNIHNFQNHKKNNVNKHEGSNISSATNKSPNKINNIHESHHATNVLSNNRTINVAADPQFNYFTYNHNLLYSNKVSQVNNYLNNFYPPLQNKNVNHYYNLKPPPLPRPRLYFSIFLRVRTTLSDCHIMHVYKSNVQHVYSLSLIQKKFQLEITKRSKLMLCNSYASHLYMDHCLAIGAEKAKYLIECGMKMLLTSLLFLQTVSNINVKKIF